MEDTKESMFDRTILLLGEQAVECLQKRHVIVFGVGGVGGYAIESMARAGIGNFTLVDHDIVTKSNINRQIIATEETIGRYKTEVMKERIASIHPETIVTCRNEFYLPQNADTFQFSDYDYVIDAVDTVTAKLEIVQRAKQEKVPVISCMGAGNKLDPTSFCVKDIYQTKVCPLARVMRKECKARGIESLKVVYSEEKPRQGNGRIPGSISFVPSVAGLILGGEVIKDLCVTNTIK